MSTARTARRRARATPAGKRLRAYRERRHFERTPEPPGKPRSSAARRKRTAGLRYVIQKHAARRLHYDFRLELDGVLLSWAVPKGPSAKPSDRRLAVRTEDHPLEYADFEGVIPEGEYGGGSVIVWDRGSWEPEGDPHDALKRGRLTFTLRGEKLRGRWHLVRTRQGDDKRENWMLFKGRDEAARGSRTRAKTSRDVVDLVRALPVDFPLSNLEKVLYPDEGIRKAELIAYVASTAEWSLPHVADRPLTLLRCPDGRHRKCFFQKHAGKGVPAAVRRVEIREENGRVEPYMLVRDLAGLVALAQLGALEVHTWTCHANLVERPDLLIVDVDPDQGLAWERVVEAALTLREGLGALGLESFAKTTGGKGLHVVAPVARRLTWDAHKEFARAFADRIARQHPARYTINSRKVERRGRVFLDYLRNARGATAIAPYSTRASLGATVATPITWRELEAGIDPRDFTIYTIPGRLGKLRKDPWTGFSELRQSISNAARRELGIL